MSHAGQVASRGPLGSGRRRAVTLITVDWFYPVRHLEGAALLSAGKAAAAEAVYREDLRRHPHNGWALFGLWQALSKQNKPDAAAIKTEFETAWQRADFTLTATAF